MHKYFQFLLSLIVDAFLKLNDNAGNRGLPLLTSASLSKIDRSILPCTFIIGSVRISPAKQGSKQQRIQLPAFF